jgi:hypothetical protein
MAIYRIVWMFLMVIIVAPAFVMASGMEGIGFQEASVFTMTTFQGYGVPHFLAALLSYPVTIVATLIPGTSSLAAWAGDWIWQGVGILFLAVFFLNLEPPFYRATPSAE